MRELRKSAGTGLAAVLMFFQSEARAEPSPFAAVTVGDFLVACRTNTSSCSSAIGTIMLQRANVSGICLPNNSGDYTVPVIAWLAAHPETAAMKTSDGAVLALTTVYRC